LSPQSGGGYWRESSADSWLRGVGKQRARSQEVEKALDFVEQPACVQYKATTMLSCREGSLVFRHKPKCLSCTGDRTGHAGGRFDSVYVLNRLLSWGMTWRRRIFEPQVGTHGGTAKEQCSDSPYCGGGHRARKPGNAIRCPIFRETGKRVLEKPREPDLRSGVPCAIAGGGKSWVLWDHDRDITGWRGG